MPKTQIMNKRNLIAQWAFDTRPILGRFKLWLEDVEVERLDDSGGVEFLSEITFAGGAMERGFIMTAAVTLEPDFSDVRARARIWTKKDSTASKKMLTPSAPT